MMNEAFQRSDDALSLSEIWDVLYGRRFLIGGITLVGAVLAAAGSYLIRPAFRADVLLVSASAPQTGGLGSLASQFGGLAELAGVNLSQGGNRSATIATLKSRSLSEAFIKDHDLLPLIFDRAWDAEAKRWKSDDPRNVPTLGDAYQTFDQEIRNVSEDKKTGLITLSIEWYDAEIAAKWANELVQRCNSRLQQETILEGQKTISYLTDQVSKSGTIEVRQALFNLIEIENKNVAVAHAREEFAFKVIDPAVPPNKRSKPNRKQIALMGLLLGFLSSSLWVLVRESRAFRPKQ